MANITTQILLTTRDDCLQSMCTVRKKKKKKATTFYLYTVFCASLFLLLSWTCPSRLLSPLEICKMLERPSSSGFLCFIIYNLVGLRVYIWRKNEPPWCPVLFLRYMGWSLSIPTAFATLSQAEDFLFKPSVSLISKFHFYEYPRRSASLLSSAVIWCFYTFDMNLTAVIAVFIKFFAKFSISFCKKGNNTPFRFSMIASIPCRGI